MSDRVTVLLDEPISTINPNIYGHFAEHLGACIYDGIWVGEESPIPNHDGIRLDVVEALRRLSPPVVRWPGGCFADDYHWQDGIGPRTERPRRVNIWWGEAIETNEFGTHEFIHFCRLIGAQPYICGNVGSGSPRELREWLEYCNFPAGSTLADLRAANGSPEPFAVSFWGVGNENWGCGGHMTPEEYAAQYRRFATYLRDVGDTGLYLIACGPGGNDPEWTRRFLAAFHEARRPPQLNGLAAHYYCGTAGSATEYTTEEWYALLFQASQIEGLVCQQRAIMDGFDPHRRIGLIVDEWGTWHPPAPGHHPRHLWQQNTMRDALVAALTLDIFNRHADKVVMANIAQMVNVLQSMILTDGPRMLVTPTAHVYEMYRHHQGGTSLRTVIDSPGIEITAAGPGAELAALSGSASLRDGVITLSLVNTRADEPAEVDILLRGGACRDAAVRVLADADIHAHNTFEEPKAVEPRSAKPPEPGTCLTYTCPPASVTVLRLTVGT